MKTGYLAFIDVLGFREGVINHKSSEYINNYKQVLNEVVESKLDRKSDVLDYIVFSDSIVITSKNDEYNSLEAILAVCSKLFFSLTIWHIPIRGSISYGLYERSKLQKSKNVFLAGPALVEAYDFEEKQNWLGLALCPSVVEKNFDLLEKWSWETERVINNPLFGFLYKCDKIPLKSKDGVEDSIDGFIVYPEHSAAREKEGGSRFLKALHHMRVSAIVPKIRKKYDNSIQFFKPIEEPVPLVIMA
jgi:hypothetical protein